MTGPLPEKRLVYVISRYTYRSTFIVREIDELAARGWTITVVSLRRPIFEPGRTARDLPYTVAYDSGLSARALAAAASAAIGDARAIGGYVRLMLSTFGRNPGLLVRNLSIIPQACYYAARVRRTVSLSIRSASGAGRNG